ncbi:MAG: hypothetical protein WBA87_15450 [Microbacterium sp.]
MPEMITVDAAADALHAAAADRSPLDPCGISMLTLRDAYRTQHALISRHLADGDRVAGAKLGFTSRAKMQQMGVHSPIVGVILETGRIANGGAVGLDRFIHPKVEPEIALLLDDDLDPESPIDGQLHRIGAIAPALEIIDSRFAGFSFTLSSVVADNTSAAGFAVGSWTRFTPGMEIDNLAVELTVGDRIAAIGSTAAILGDPLRVLPLLLTVAREHGHALTAGSVVLAGAATAAVPLTVGLAEASIAGLGRVAFSAREES